MASLFRAEFELCQVRPGETIALLTDLESRREYVAAAFAAADTLGSDIYEMCVNAIPSWDRVGVATVGKCKGTVDALKAAGRALPGRRPRRRPGAGGPGGARPVRPRGRHARFL